MIIIDLSQGFTETGFVKALYSLKSDTFNTLTTILTDTFFTEIKYHIAVLEIIKILSGSETENSYSIKEKDLYISYEELLKQNNEFSAILQKILNSIPEKLFSLYDFLMSLFIIIFMERIVQNVSIKATTPCFGYNTPSITLNLFKDQRIILNIDSCPIYPISASVIAYYFIPFSTCDSIRIKSVKIITDPFNRICKMKIIETNDSIDLLNKNDEFRDVISVLQTNIDDCTAEIISDAMNKIMSAGALDYTICPATMKKGRQGFLIEVLCDQSNTDKIIELLLKLTSTFGIRKYSVERVKLKRSQRHYDSKYGQIMIKEGFIGEKLIKATPEFDDIIRLANETGISPYILYHQIMGELNNFL